MNEPENQDVTTEEWLALRADLIGVVRRIERTLESRGHPIKSAVVTRKERRRNEKGKDR
jgi:hypothetical protein